MNIMLATKISILEIYYHFNFWCFCLNFFIIPLIVNIIFVPIKKIMSEKELLYNQYKKNKNNSEQNNLKNIRLSKGRIFIYGFLSLLFLIFNCILVTSFCAVYPNSVSKLGINVISSIFGSWAAGLIFFIFGACIRKSSLQKKKKTLFNFSKIFNPMNLSCNCKKRNNI